MLCCQIEREVPSVLPFQENLCKGFYDGPCDGLTTCEICKQGFYFREVEFISDSLRVYFFTRIPINHYEFAEKFGSRIFTDFRRTIKQGELLEDFPIDEQAEMLYSEFENIPFTHICLVGWYLSNSLLWKKASPDVFMGIDCLEDWLQYFGITFDPDMEEYYPFNEIWRKYLAEKYL